jgi:class I fructose-bisphosphate aldolase
MNLGKQTRLNRLFAHPSGRLCSVAIDHFIGYQNGMPENLRDLPAIIKTLVAAGPDAVTMHKGVAVSCWAPYAGRIPLITQSIIGRPDDTASANEFMSTPADAIGAGADAFATCAFLRGPSENAHLRRVADFVREAEKLGIPVVLHVYPRVFHGDGQVEISYTPEHIAWAVRCGIEVGADVIKVPFCGDVAAYAQIVRSCPVPVVAAGGPKTGTLDEALQLARDVVASGAKGMTIGRNVWGAPDPAQALREFKRIVHGEKA